jgi:flavodoxin
MKVAIVYDTRTGTTAGAAEKMAEAARAAGHECTVANTSHAEARSVARADAIVVGAWTQGYFVIRQHPSEGFTRWIESASFNGKPVAVYTTYKLAVGSTLRQMSAMVEAAGGKVTGMYKVKGARVPEGFEAWLSSLARSSAI